MKKFFYLRFSRKIECDFKIFYKRFPWKFFCSEKFLKGFAFEKKPALVLHVLHLEGISFITMGVLKAISFFGSKLRKSNLREFLSNLSLIPAIDLLAPSLSIARYVCTTLQKLIVDSEVRGTTLPKLIVKWKVKVKSEVKVKVKVN